VLVPRVHGNDPSGSTEQFCPAERLSASQEGLVFHGMRVKFNQNRQGHFKQLFPIQNFV
jgi:hypothetical protein